MSIYTKKGDDGTTGLIGGDRISKGEARLESIGTIDELNGWLGLIANQIDDNPIREELSDVQSMLFWIGSKLADNKLVLEHELKETIKTEIAKLEKSIDRCDKVIAPLKNFILPGGCLVSSNLQIARSVCRRAERNLVRFDNMYFCIAYINRLSDYLYTLARFFNHQSTTPEQIWSGIINQKGGQ